MAAGTGAGGRGPGAANYGDKDPLKRAFPSESLLKNPTPFTRIRDLAVTVQSPVVADVGRRRTGAVQLPFRDACL